MFWIVLSDSKISSPIEAGDVDILLSRYLPIPLGLVSKGAILFRQSRRDQYSTMYTLPSLIKSNSTTFETTLSITNAQIYVTLGHSATSSHKIYYKRGFIPGRKRLIIVK